MLRSNRSLKGIRSLRSQPTRLTDKVFYNSWSTPTLPEKESPRPKHHPSNTERQQLILDGSLRHHNRILKDGHTPHHKRHHPKIPHPPPYPILSPTTFTPPLESSRPQRLHTILNHNTQELSTEEPHGAVSSSDLDRAANIVANVHAARDGEGEEKFRIAGSESRTREVEDFVG